MTAYYNEHDIYAAQWLRNLINAGHIAPGIVDERSIEDVHPSDLRGFTQCHFFAGIGVWSHSLRAAAWPDDRPVWTGSCPCQPFSAAGKGSGFDDQRHLWPAFHHLIQECKPAIVLGEQVASKDADPWVNLVQLDLEALGYGFGAVPFPAAGVGAPHIRDRLYWVADTDLQQRPHREPGFSAEHTAGGRIESAATRAGLCGDLWLADTSDQRQHWRGASQTSDGRDAARIEPERLCDAGGLADVHGTGCSAGSEGSSTVGHGQTIEPDSGAGRLADTQHDGCGGQESHQAKPNGNRENFGILDRGHFAPQGQPATSPTNGYWRDADWLLCRDGKWRPVEPGTFPLVAGPAGGMGRSRADWHTPAGKEGFGHRAGRLKGYGNAINAEAARLFIECVMEGRA